MLIVEIRNKRLRLEPAPRRCAKSILVLSIRKIITLNNKYHSERGTLAKIVVIYKMGLNGSNIAPYLLLLKFFISPCE